MLILDRSNILNPLLLSNLKKIVDTIPLEIVLSSSWRFNPDLMTYLVTTLESYDIGSKLIGTTPLRTDHSRAENILHFINTLCEYENLAVTDIKFLVLDDGHAVAKDLPEHTILTESETGLTDEITELVIEYFN